MNLTKKQNNKCRFKTFFKNQLFIDTILSILVFGIMLLILSNPTKYTSGTISGLTLFFTSVLPGLFPFMLLTKILTELNVVFKFSSKCEKFTKKVFGTPGVSLYAFLMSILSGYPIGAKIIGDLYEKKLISKLDAKKMSVFCTTSGPIFVIGTVGSIMFKSFTFGLILYASHILSSFLLGVIFHLFSKSDDKNFVSQTAIIQPVRSKNMITDCLVQTVNSLFVVGAYITMFYLISEIFETLKIFDMAKSVILPVAQNFGGEKYIDGILYGILEVTRGMSTLSVFSNKVSLVLASGLLSFSGLSIIMQSVAFLKPAGVKTSSFILYKVLHAALSMILCSGFVLLI